MGTAPQGEIPGQFSSEDAERLRKVSSPTRALEDFAAANPDAEEFDSPAYARRAQGFTVDEMAPVPNVSLQAPIETGSSDLPAFLVNRAIRGARTADELEQVDPRKLTREQLLLYSQKREELGLVEPADTLPKPPPTQEELNAAVANLPPLPPIDEAGPIPLPTDLDGGLVSAIATVEEPAVASVEEPVVTETVSPEEELEQVLQGPGAGGGEPTEAEMDEAIRAAAEQPSPNGELVISKAKLGDVTRMQDDLIGTMTDEEVASIKDQSAKEYVENRRKHMEYKKYSKEQVLALPEGSITGLTDAEVDLIQDEEARNEFRRRRSELNNRRYENMQAQDVSNMSEDEIAVISDEQLGAIRNEDARNALRGRVEASRAQRAQEQERVRYRTVTAREASQLGDAEVKAMSAAQIDAIDDENARRLVKTRQDDMVRAEAEANRFENMNTDTIDSLSEDELVAITDEQIDRVTDPRAKTVLREKRRSAQEAAESRRNLESIQTFVASGIDVDTIFTTPEQIPGFDSLPKPLQEVIKANMANRDALRKNQLEGDKFKKKEEEASARLENLKLAKKERELFFRRMKFLLGGLAAGVAVGAVLSGAGELNSLLSIGVTGWGGLIGLGGGVTAELIDQEFSIDRAKIDYEIAKSKSKIQENQSNLIRIKDRAIKRDVSTLTAFSTIAGEIFARGTGITDEAQKKRFIGDFQREMGVPVMNAILAV